jgi:DNA-binding CsgD family transcriptional regulator
MTAETISQYFPTTTGDQARQMLSLFQKLEDVPKLFYALILEDASKYKFAFTSPLASDLTGHDLSNFSYEDGFSFFYSITPPEYRMLVQEQEKYYFKKARQPGLDVSKPFILEITAALTHRNSHILAVRLIAVLLEFTSERLPKLSINAWQIIDDLPDDLFMSSRMEIETILRTIHKVYKVAYPCTSTAGNLDAEPLKLSYALYDCEEITKQEYRVLKLLADGLSTKKLADTLCISENTAETHRRHLLQKLKAVNVAEMIKKATKLYWLE